jgi:hypothetical protein
VSRLVVCPECQGTGGPLTFGAAGGSPICLDCDGAGRIADRRQPIQLRPTGLLYLIFAAMLAAGFLAGRVSASAPRPSQDVAPATTGAPLGDSRVPSSSAAFDGQASSSGAPPSPTAAPAQPIAAAPAFVRSGVASWYCNFDAVRGPVSPCTANITDGPGFDGWIAAGPALRVGEWRDREVIVFGPAGYSTATIVDFCACPGRLVDLYADLFLAVCGPLSMGICEVSVTW